MRLVQLFSLTMVVLHMWRCIVVWQIGSCNLLYYTACSTELVFQIDYFSNVALRNSSCEQDCTLMFAIVVLKMVCELSFASLVYSFSFEIENARLRCENYTCRLGLHM